MMIRWQEWSIARMVFADSVLFVIAPLLVACFLIDSRIPISSTQLFSERLALVAAFFLVCRHAVVLFGELAR